MKQSQPLLRADFSPETLRRNLSAFFTPGRIHSTDLTGRIRRLDLMYAQYLALYPHGLWAPGLVITSEMRRATEMLFPLDSIHSAFRALYRQACGFVSSSETPLFLGATSWLDLVLRFPERVRDLNPARLIAGAASDDSFRLELLFSLHLPSQHGGAFGRYPGQAAFVRRWLTSSSVSDGSRIRCLDAACGTGEGTYELAHLVAERRGGPDGWTVHGMSRDPLEIFAAAHGWFPHDPGRGDQFRRLACAGGLLRPPAVTFGVEDVTEPSAEGPYDVVVCNGLLGGPVLHEEGEVGRVIGLLAARLAPGGLLLAADRFHEGWERRLSKECLRQLFVRHGLRLVEPGEGVGGIKKNSSGNSGE